MKNEYKSNSQTVTQLSVLLSNSKYTYAQFTAFHQTVLNILENSDLSYLDTTQMKNTMFFINIVVNLLDAPTIQPNHQQNKANSSGTDQTVENIQNQKPRSTNPYTLKARSAQTIPAKEDLNKLLTWINTIVIRKHITIEEMLDQFFLLQLKTILVNPNHAN